MILPVSVPTPFLAAAADVRSSRISCNVSRVVYAGLDAVSRIPKVWNEIVLNESVDSRISLSDHSDPETVPTAGGNISTYCKGQAFQVGSCPQYIDY